MKNNITGVDKISDLCDALLTHILSFLSPRKVVQTCILSKRWRRTWASVPVLKFNIGMHVRADKFCVTILFVKQVLLNRERSLSLDTFKFRWHSIWSREHYQFNPSEMECILLALEFKPRVLSVHVYKHLLLEIDCIGPIFTCASLQSISLEIKSKDGLRKSSFQMREMNLPLLKRLKLSFVRVDDYFLKMLFAGCPILEKLHLFCCYLDTPMLYSEVLKSLVFKCCTLEKKLVISTPSLVYLEIFLTRIECANVHDDVGLNFLNHSSNFRISYQSAQAKVTCLYYLHIINL
jgi:hypothetical protein